MVFQDPYNALNPRLTIGADAGRGADACRAAPRRRDIPRRVGELLDLVALDRAFADRKPRSMSGGQCQRAGIARALAVDPRLVIADECVAGARRDHPGADHRSASAICKARMGLTLLFIAHDLAIVRNLCERVVVMHRGEIVEEGRPAEVFARPAASLHRGADRGDPRTSIPTEPLRAADVLRRRRSTQRGERTHETQVDGSEPSPRSWPG